MLIEHFMQDLSRHFIDVAMLPPLTHVRYQHSVAQFPSHLIDREARLTRVPGQESDRMWPADRSRSEPFPL